MEKNDVINISKYKDDKIRAICVRETEFSFARKKLLEAINEFGYVVEHLQPNTKSTHSINYAFFEQLGALEESILDLVFLIEIFDSISRETK